jgi:hypothetical protein
MTFAAHPVPRMGTGVLHVVQSGLVGCLQGHEDVHGSVPVHEELGRPGRSGASRCRAHVRNPRPRAGQAWCAQQPEVRRGTSRPADVGERDPVGSVPVEQGRIANALREHSPEIGPRDAIRRREGVHIVVGRRLRMRHRDEWCGGTQATRPGAGRAVPNSGRDCGHPCWRAGRCGDRGHRECGPAVSPPCDDGGRGHGGNRLDREHQCEQRRQDAVVPGGRAHATRIGRGRSAGDRPMVLPRAGRSDGSPCGALAEPDPGQSAGPVRVRQRPSRSAGRPRPGSSGT